MEINLLIGFVSGVLFTSVLVPIFQNILTILEYTTQNVCTRISSNTAAYELKTNKNAAAVNNKEDNVQRLLIGFRPPTPIEEE